MGNWQNTDTLLLWIAIIIGVMMMLVGTLITVFYISFKKVVTNKDNELKVKLEHERNLIKSCLVTQENERLRIAGDLHDSIISKMTVIRLKAAMKTDYNELDNLLGESITELRRISHDLSPLFYEEKKTLANLLIDVLKEWNSSYNITYTTDIRKTVTIDQSIKLQLVRIIQELLTNIHKHANASDINFMLRISNQYISIIMSDNGIGFNYKNNNGIGLQNIELRITHLKGVYKFKSSPNKGTRFIFLCDFHNFNDPLKKLTLCNS